MGKNGKNGKGVLADPSRLKPLNSADKELLRVVVEPGLPQLKSGPLFWVKLTNVSGDDGGMELGSVSVHETFVASPAVGFQCWDAAESITI